MSFFLCFWQTSAAFANTSTERVRQETNLQVRQKLTPLLNKYCGEACEVVSVDIEVEELMGETDDLGFEQLSTEKLASQFAVSKIGIDLQVDDRISPPNRERLQKIIINSLKNISPIIDVRWLVVTVPQMGVADDLEDRLKKSLQNRLETAVDSVFNNYCPKECVLSRIAIEGRLITADEARDVNDREMVKERSGRGILKVDNVDLEVSLDENLTEDTRGKILNVLRAKTRFIHPINIEVNVVDFPESYESKKARESDPFGLERLRQTLQIFKELASTKEIISSSNSNSSVNDKSEATKLENASRETLASEKSNNTENMTSKSQESNNSNSTNSSNNNSSSNSTESEKSSLEEKSASEERSSWVVAAYVGGALLGLLMVTILVWRLVAAQRDAKMMMEHVNGSPSTGANTGRGQEQGFGATAGPGPSYGGPPPDLVKQIGLKSKIEGLKQELIQIFTDVPKVAKETFTRMLIEDGVEETAKYVHIFGQMIVFELLSDPNIQRELYELGEFYHRSNFQFTDEEKVDLLEHLRTRVTASEIRVLSRRQFEKFDFLQNLDPQQVYRLIEDEKALVQSIVITQLDHKRRRMVFDMYEGEPRIALMRELCRVDAIPKDYLGNVAKALHKKVLSKSEFDTENLRSTDILFDLLEKAPLQEQRSLMAELLKSNAEAARSIKQKLVTVEMLPYLKDGHLLEVVMGLDRGDLLTFLAGTRENVREVLLAKAPGELAQSWLEDIQQYAGADEATYRLAELKVLTKIKALAVAGSFRILDINEIIFAPHMSGMSQDEQMMRLAMERRNIAA